LDSCIHCTVKLRVVVNIVTFLSDTHRDFGWILDLLTTYAHDS
jgi:hypothetical protein